ncbi:Ferredoxin 7Fe, putative [Ricinus communis]|uniref:Ferredoxin 7Fe, putative n=1 Tax=Ricinus communis TaxID=3988 RepID=B9TI75_RICCO|nr:Ferredoxin 7Fe, putative [Ricinus communis]
MAYVIAAPCIADYSCVEICPVNCISPGPNEEEFDDAEQMYINPDVCIDCGACRDVCPVLAIYEEGCLPEKWKHYAGINKEFFSARGE